MKKLKVVLAYSGGLDTSFCLKYLTADKGMEVHAAIVQTGGFSDSELKDIEQKALHLGATSFKVLDETEYFYKQCVKYLLFGNVLRNHTYPLSVSAERIFQALAIINYAKAIDAEAVAHGSTGAGNDQVRFDLAFEILGPGIEIITPIRDLSLSREEEVDYLQRHGVDWSWKKAKYSINKGIWGTSVGGVETLTSDEYLPEEAWPTPKSSFAPETITLTFDHGEPIAFNQEKLSPLEVISRLQILAQPYGIGRDIHVGDTIIGIKGRVGFEAAAPLILIKAHQLLEKHTLSKWQMYWKDQLATWYGMALHEGQYLEPVMRQIETFLGETQDNVSGEVRVLLDVNRFTCLGVSSPHDLMQTRFGSYGEKTKAWNGNDVKGFTHILANAPKIYYTVNGDEI